MLTSAAGGLNTFEEVYGADGWSASGPAETGRVGAQVRHRSLGGLKRVDIRID